jgi:hypothetical protein
VLRVPYVIEPPALPDEKDLHPLAVATYHAMAQSAVSKQYEPSEWVLLQITCGMLSEELLPGLRRSAERLKVVMQNLAKLGATQPDRLRRGIDVSRPEGNAPAAKDDVDADIAAAIAAVRGA